MKYKFYFRWKLGKIKRAFR